MGNHEIVPWWPVPRVNWPNTHMLDVRVNSVWVDFAIDYIADRMTDGMLDGVFLDVIGARLWGSSDWPNWPLSERQDWQAGIVDFLRRLDQARRQLNPNFKIVNNNRWFDSLGRYFVSGEQFVDGNCWENVDPTVTVHRIEAARPFSNLGHRRVLAISKTVEQAQAWAEVPGVTHVCYTNGGNYGTAQSAVVPYTDLRIPEMQVLIDRLKQTTAELEVAAAAAVDAKVQAETEAQAAVTAKAAIESKLNQIKDIVNG